MPILFEVVDPRGYTVICTEECWNNHILENHSIMNGLEEDVKNTIGTPYPGFIYQDRDNPERHIYYGRNPGRPFYIKVVVEFGLFNQGEVITAFLTDSPKSGEVIIWPE